jgi:hypothetical protein
MTLQEQDAEKERVAQLTPFQKDQELRHLNRQISKLEVLKGINTGELYTWLGKYKALSRDYGMLLMGYYFCCWSLTGASIYAAMTVLDADGTALLQWVDFKMNWDLTSKIDPSFGKIGIALAINELAEPARLPFVIVTVKPVAERFFPTKY